MQGLIIELWTPAAFASGPHGEKLLVTDGCSDCVTWVEKDVVDRFGCKRRVHGSVIFQVVCGLLARPAFGVDPGVRYGEGIGTKTLDKVGQISFKFNQLY